MCGGGGGVRVPGGNPLTLGSRLGIPNPVPSLGVPGLIPPSALPTNLGQFMTPGKMVNAMGNLGQTLTKSLAQANIDAAQEANPSIMRMLGRGTLDTTILGQNRRMPAAAIVGSSNTLGG